MMIQGNYARAAVAKLQAAMDPGGGYPPPAPAPEMAEAFRQLLLWIDMVERKLDQVEVAANRRARWPGSM